MTRFVPGAPLETTWRVPGTPDQVRAILDDVAAWPRWWPAVCLEAHELASGDGTDTGRVVSVRSQGWLSRTVQWTCRVTSPTEGDAGALKVYGDLEGDITWTAAATDQGTLIHWTVALRQDPPPAGPLAGTYHRLLASGLVWAMARGEASLRLALRRHRATDATERDAVPAPPGPVSGTPLPLLMGVVGTVGAVAGAAVLLRRPRRP